MSQNVGITRRKVAGAKQNDDDLGSGTLRQRSSVNNTPEAQGKGTFNSTKTIDCPKLSLLEELILLGIKDSEGYLSFWNDSLSYVLRGCMIIELALRKRIRIKKDAYTGVVDVADRLIEVISAAPTGEVLLDETLKVLKNTDKIRSVSSWVDLLSGETWSISKAGFQLKQVRERLSKGLVDKGILRTEKKNFVFFDMATHPVQDYKAKNEIILRVFDTLNLPRSAALLNRSAGGGVSQQLNSTSMASSTINLSNLTGRLKIITVEHSKYYPNETNNLFALLRRVCLVCAACAGNVLENPLNHLDMETRDHAFMRAEELLNIYGHWPYVRDSPIYTDVSESDVASMQVEEVVSAVLSVFRRMDRVL